MLRAKIEFQPCRKIRVGSSPAGTLRGIAVIYFGCGAGEMRRTGRNGLIQKQILWLTNYGNFVYLKFDDTGISCATAMRACVSAEAGDFHSKVGCGHSVEREIFPFTDFAIIGVNCLITIRCRDLQVEGGNSGRGPPGYNVFSKDNV